MTWGTMFDDLQKRLFGFDNNYVRTVRDLTIHPKRVVESILNGVRVIYIGPVGFYFLMLTVYLLLASIIGVDLHDMMAETSKSFQPGGPMSEKQKQFSNDFLNAVSDNFRIFSFFTVPFFVLANWVLNIKKRMNFIEHSVVVFYALGYPFIFSILFMFFYRAFHWNPGFYQSLIAVLFFAWASASVYSKNKSLGFLKGLLAYLLGMVFMMIFIFIFIPIYLALI